MPSAAALGSAGVSLAEGITSANGESQASKAAQSASNANNQLAGQTYATNTANEQPFVNTGQESNSALAGLLGVGGNPAASQEAFNNYLGSTNYQFTKNQGDQGIEYANAPAFDSGATSKALDTYNTGLAGSALQGYEGELGTLNSTGLSAAGTLGQLGTQYTSQVASDNNNAAGVKGSTAIGTASAENNALTGLEGGFTASSYAPSSNSALAGIGTSSPISGSGGFGGGAGGLSDDAAALGF